MAYCLRSFVETLDQVLNPHKHCKKWLLDHHHRPQIQSLFEDATFLQHFLDKSSPQIQERISSLEDQIMDAAQNAADTLETIITDQILLNPNDQNFTISPPDLGRVIRVFEDAKQEVIKFKIEDATQPSYNPVSSTRYPDSKNMVLGVEEDLNELRYRLTSTDAKLDIIPIVGMGGIGKTTLARILYDEYSSTRSYFDRCAWVTVSQSYDPQLILKTLLACVIRKPLDDLSEQETRDLITTLYRTLVGTRYLIVLDDIWSYKAWDDFQRAFARDNTGSRIIFTTRENSLVDYVKSHRHEMRLMKESDSWELIRRKVFGDESFPPELQETGKIIAKNCGGLPLALQVVGGLLANSPINKDFWELVAHNVSLSIATADDQFSGIFLSSFDHLPHYLKPCFLYMGVFPGDREISTSRLIKLWIAEGFLNPIPNKCLEEAAEIHLNELVNRNLIFVRTRGVNGEAQSYGMHDLLRDLCLSKSREKKFFYVTDPKKVIAPEDVLCIRRIRVHSANNEVECAYGSLKLTSVVRSFIHTGHDGSNEFLSRLCYKSSLLRVLDVQTSTQCDIQEGFSHLVNLRYLAISSRPPSIARARCISLLKNLQTLIVSSLESLSILEHLPKLRQLEFGKLEDANIIYPFEIYHHENLLSLSIVPLLNLTCLLDKIPNLKKLVISYEDSVYHSVVDLTCFLKLESLELICARNSSSKIIFPPSLKTLKLSYCKLSQTLLNEISILPGLQVLSLRYDFTYDTWEPTEGEFCQLQCLEIDGSNLENWLATESSFPVLQHLFLRDCRRLSEIPYDIGGIETLETIDLDRCKASLFNSARKIIEEQLEYGNPLVRLQLGQTFEDIEIEKAAKLSKMYETWVSNHGLTVEHEFSFPKETIFPLSLKKLKLIHCILSQTILSAIGVLPELQLLNLTDCIFEDSTWEPSVGQFCQLHLLEISNAENLVKWFATENHFPVLSHLVIEKCHDLSEIPIGIGRIVTLDIIEVQECKVYVFDSARRILEEQREFGNTLLELRLGCTFEDAENERAATQLEMFESNVLNHELIIVDEDFFSTKTLFPSSLKNLMVKSCRVNQSTLSAMGVISELEVLKLNCCTFKDSTWDSSGSEFSRLQHLEINKAHNLREWLATEIHFPVLKHLVIKDCDELLDIPIGIGRIKTLEIIEVEESELSLVDSARLILEEQRELGNTLLQIWFDGALVVEREEKE